MDLGDGANVVAIIGGIAAGMSATLGGAMWIGGWIEKRQAEGKAWSAQDRRLGQLSDRTQSAISHIERDLSQHIRDDHERFLKVSDDFGEVKASLARIEGALGTGR